MAVSFGDSSATLAKWCSLTSESFEVLTFCVCNISLASSEICPGDDGGKEPDDFLFLSKTDFWWVWDRSSVSEGDALSPDLAHLSVFLAERQSCWTNSNLDFSSNGSQLWELKKN